MYLYIFISSIFISTLIAKTCSKSKPPKYDIDDVYLDFPTTHYLKRVNVFKYFAEENNFSRLAKIFDKDNGIYDKIMKLFDTNEELQKDYLSTLDFYEGIFAFEKEPEIIGNIGIKGKNFKTSIGQLNFFKWVLDNDYLLHID